MLQFCLGFFVVVVVYFFTVLLSFTCNSHSDFQSCAQIVIPPHQQNCFPFPLIVSRSDPFTQALTSEPPAFSSCPWSYPSSPTSWGLTQLFPQPLSTLHLKWLVAFEMAGFTSFLPFWQVPVIYLLQFCCALESSSLYLVHLASPRSSIFQFLEPSPSYFSISLIHDLTNTCMHKRHKRSTQ